MSLVVPTVEYHMGGYVSDQVLCIFSILSRLLIHRFIHINHTLIHEFLFKNNQSSCYFFKGNAGLGKVP